MNDDEELRLYEMMYYQLQFSEHLDGMTDQKMLEPARKKLFDFDYPIFDEDYRKVLELKVLNRFWLQSIGFEEWGEFKWRFRNFFITHMDYYNRLYQSVTFNDYNPDDDIDLHDTHNRDDESRSNLHGRANSESNGHGDSVSKTDTENTSDGTTTGNEHGTVKTTESGKTTGTEHSDSKTTDSGTQNSRKTVLDPPQSATEMNANYANVVNIDNENHDNAGTNVTDSNTDGTTDNEINTTTDNKTDGTSKVNDNGTSETNASETTKNTNVANNTQEANATTTEAYVSRRYGRNGNHMRGELIKAQRENIIDIDNMLLEDISRRLFSAVY